MVSLSVLDLVPIQQGSTPAVALRNSLELARHAERLGYRRYWVAEHHNMTGVASAATAVVISYLANGTSTIRLGSGGIMLTNHAPLVIAEQFGTLETLFPGRIDLGVGRAPGADPATLQSLRRDPSADERFPHDVQELQQLLGPVAADQAIQAMPGADTRVPLWVLGSGTTGARVAAARGVSFAYAAHFMPDSLHEALALYRERFTPSEQQDRPYAMVGIQVVAADTDDEARRLFTSVQQTFVNRRRGRRGPLPTPIDDIDAFWTPDEKAELSHKLRYAIVGGPETVWQGLERLLADTRVDEIIVTSNVFDPAARLRSYEILAEVARSMESEPVQAARA
jgi:luciferase family oxidoreductase group 1